MSSNATSIRTTGPTWLQKQVEVELTEEEKETLRGNIDKLLDTEHRRYQFRTSDRLAVIRLDRMEEWSPWLIIPWKNAVLMGKWKVCGVEEFGDAILVFFCLNEENV